MLAWLPWEEATEVAGATAAVWAGTLRSTRRWAGLARPWARELTLILVLYAMWQYAGAWSLGRAGAAVARGRFVWDVERALHVPSERAVQALVLHERALVYFLNVYYAAVHVPALGVCLVWLFVRHRDQYPPVRTVVALVTGACLAIQLFPVAPPRLIPGLGIVDTGAVVGPSVYSRGAPGLDQLSAMPSVHVAWALIVGGSIFWVCRSRWRWLALAYPVMTAFTVVATGNHYWADGAVAAVLSAAATLLVWRVYSRPLFRPATTLVASDPDVPSVFSGTEPDAAMSGSAVGTGEVAASGPRATGAGPQA
jgi:hypothetical protein